MFGLYRIYNTYQFLIFDSLEIGYYFLIPPFIWLIAKSGRYWSAFLFVFFIYSVYSNLYFPRERNHLFYPQVATFLVGSISAVISCKLENVILKRETISKTLKQILDVFSFFVCFDAFRIVFKEHGDLIPFSMPQLIPVRGVAIVSYHVAFLIVKEINFPSSLSTFFENNLLCYFGKISFSWYLFHVYAIYWDKENDEHAQFDILGFRFLLSIILASFIHYTIEIPLNRVTNYSCNWVRKRFEEQKYEPLTHITSKPE